MVIFYNHKYLFIIGFVFIVCLIMYIIKQFNMFNYINMGLIFVVTTSSFIYPKFNFIFMVLFSCFFTALTFSSPFGARFSVKQQNLLIQILHFLNKYLILDFMSVIYIRFFCVPVNVFYKRLLFIFMISACYILSSRFYFVHVTFNKTMLPDTYLILIYIALFLGISVVYFCILINVSSFFVFAACRINPGLLSPSVLFVLGVNEDADPIKTDSQKTGNQNTDCKYSFINITSHRHHYRQQFNNTNPGAFKFFGYWIAFCGSAAAVGTFWYSKMQAEAAKAQVTAQVDNNRQMERQNDLEEVSQGLRTRESYESKWS